MFIERLEQIKKKFVNSCKICKGIGFLDDGRVCDCLIKFRIYNRLLPRGFPEEYLDLEKDEILKNIKMKKESEKICQWFLKNLDFVLDKGLSLFITGKIGIGKTSLAIILAKEIARWCLSEEHYQWDFEAYYLDIDTFCMKVKKDEISNIMGATVVVLDEFGRDAFFTEAKDWIIRELERFLRYRIANRLVTIICSNVPVDNLVNIYGERISSLLGISGKDMNGLVYRSLVLEGFDLRRGMLNSRWG